MNTKDTKNPIHGINADQVLERLRQWNGGQDFTWECTMYFKVPSGSSSSISEADKKTLKRFFRQIQETINNPKEKLSVKRDKRRMIWECANTRPEENKRIREVKKLDSEKLSASLTFNLVEKDGNLVFEDRKLFEDVFCHWEERRKRNRGFFENEYEWVTTC